MATETPTSAPSTVESRLRELELNLDRLSRMNTTLPPPPAEQRTWLERWFPGISLLAIVAFAFWLGMINTTVDNAATKTEKIYSIVLDSKDSLSTRTSVIESKLTAIDAKLDEMLAQTKPKSSKR